MYLAGDSSAAGANPQMHRRRRCSPDSTRAARCTSLGARPHVTLAATCEVGPYQNEWLTEKPALCGGDATTCGALIRHAHDLIEKNRIAQAVAESELACVLRPDSAEALCCHAGACFLLSLRRRSEESAALMLRATSLYYAAHAIEPTLSEPLEFMQLAKSFPSDAIWPERSRATREPLDRHGQAAPSSISSSSSAAEADCEAEELGAGRQPRCYPATRRFRELLLVVSSRVYALVKGGQ